MELPEEFPLGWTPERIQHFGLDRVDDLMEAACIAVTSEEREGQLSAVRRLLDLVREGHSEAGHGLVFVATVQPDEEIRDEIMEALTSIDNPSAAAVHHVLRT